MKCGALFSGGKDSCYAAYLATKQGNELACLISVISENPESYMFHTPSINQTINQAEAMDIPLLIHNTKGEKELELKDLEDAIKQAKKKYKIEAIITGALHSEYQASRIQKICDNLGLRCINPLWHKNEIQYLDELIENKFKVMIIGVFAYPLDKSWLGRMIDNKFIEDVEKLKEKYKIHPAGEGGEFETFVLDCPLFKNSLKVIDKKISSTGENSWKMEINTEVSESNSDLSQHFLVDKKVLEKEIKEADLSKEDKVIEIGAGKGFLTKVLAEKSKYVLAFEKDESLKKELDKMDFDNLKIVYDDAMNYDWRGYKIVSNIPYFLSGDLILKAIKDNIESITLIVGETFKEKLTNSEGKIGFIANLFYEITPVIKIEKTSFNPVPRTDSWLVNLRKKQMSDSEKFLVDVINRHGKIKNALMYSLVNSGKTKNQSKDIIDKMQLSKQVLEKPTSKITKEFLEKIKDLI